MNQPYQSEYPFLHLGMNYIKFAKEEKNLFAFLFMANHIQAQTPVQLVGSGKVIFVNEMAAMLNLSQESAKTLFWEVCILSHGIATLILRNDIDFSESEIEQLLVVAFKGIYTHLQADEKKEIL